MLQALTRDSGPTVSIICLHNINGEKYLDAAGKYPVDLEKEPNRDQIKKLLFSEVKLSYRGCVRHFPIDMVPAAWKKTSMLRHHRAVIFENGCHEQSGIRLDPELGIIISRKGENHDPILQSDH